MLAVPPWMPIYVEGVFYGVATLSLGWLYHYITDLKSSRPREIEIVSVTPEDKEVTNYLIFYIFPFLGFDLGSPKEAVALGFLFLVLAILYVQARMTYVHPMLALTGYHFYEVEIEDHGERKRCGLITPESYLRSGHRLEEVYEKENYVYIHSPTSENPSDGSCSDSGARDQSGGSSRTPSEAGEPRPISP
jgi:hypothetical protein